MSKTDAPPWTYNTWDYQKPEKERQYWKNGKLKEEVGRILGKK